MSIDSSIRNLPYLNDFDLKNTESVEELQDEVITALERESEGMQPDQRQQFLARVRQYAGDILNFLDHMKVSHYSFPYKAIEIACNLFDELETIGKELAHATDANFKQFSAERSAYQEFREFKLKQPEFSSATRPRVLTWEEAMEKGRLANAEMNTRQHMMLAKLMAGAIGKTTELALDAAQITFCNATPVHALACNVVEVPVKKAMAEMSSLLPKPHALPHELNRQFNIPLEDGEAYSNNAGLVAMTMIPMPPVAKLAGRLAPQAIKPVQAVVKRRVKVHELETVKVQPTPQGIARTKRFENLRVEKELVGKLKESKPQLQLPIKTTRELMLSDYVSYPYRSANLLVKQLGNKAFHIHRPKFHGKPLWPRDIPAHTKLEIVLDGLRNFANEKGLSKVLLAYDPAQYPWVTFLQQYGIKISRISEIASPKGIMLPVIEFSVPPKSIATLRKTSVVSKLIQEDSGALKLSLPSRGEAFEILETSFQQIQSKIEEITKSFLSSEQNPTVSRLNTFLSPDENPSVLDLTFHSKSDILPLVPDFATSFAELLHPNDLKALSKAFLGKKPTRVTFLQNGNGKKIYSLSYPGTSYYAFKGDYLEIVNCFLGMHKMRSLQLVHSEVPVAVAFGRNGELCYLILTDLGENYAKLLHDPHALTQFYNLGVSLGELHGKNAMTVIPGTSLHENLGYGGFRTMETLGERIELGEIRVSESRYEKLQDKLDETIRQVPLTLGFTHGDASLQNITWNRKTQKVGFIDMDSVMKRVSLEHQPLNLPVEEYYLIIDDILEVGLQANLPRKTLDDLVASFKKGYKSVYPIENPEIEKILEKAITLSFPRK